MKKIPYEPQDGEICEGWSIDYVETRRLHARWRAERGEANAPITLYAGSATSLGTKMVLYDNEEAGL